MASGFVADDEFLWRRVATAMIEAKEDGAVILTYHPTGTRGVHLP
jgi:hypothetical protein